MAAAVGQPAAVVVAAAGRPAEAVVAGRPAEAVVAAGQPAEEVAVSSHHRQSTK